MFFIMGELIAENGSSAKIIFFSEIIAFSNLIL